MWHTHYCKHSGSHGGGGGGGGDARVKNVEMGDERECHYYDAMHKVLYKVTPVRRTLNITI